MAPGRAADCGCLGLTAPMPLAVTTRAVQSTPSEASWACTAAERMKATVARRVAIFMDPPRDGIGYSGVYFPPDCLCNGAFYVLCGSVTDRTTHPPPLESPPTDMRPRNHNPDRSLRCPRGPHWVS